MNINKFPQYNISKKSCLLMPFEDFDSLLDGLNPHIKVEIDLDGLHYINYDEDRVVEEDEICDLLSDAFETRVSSVHIDDYDWTGVWVVYSEV